MKLNIMETSIKTLTIKIQIQICKQYPNFSVSLLDYTYWDIYGFHFTIYRL